MTRALLYTEKLRADLKAWKKRAKDAEALIDLWRERNRKNLVEWRKAQRTGKKRRKPGRPKGRKDSKPRKRACFRK